MPLRRIGPVLVLFACSVQCGFRNQPNPQEPVLYANLWMQTAAEYYAICEQTYALAYERVAALAEQESSELLPAVVMDLDETVIDNSAYQTYLTRAGENYSDETWEAYVQYQSEEPEPKAVPGAVEFISRTQDLGVTVIFISNRNQTSRAETLQTLERLGIDISDAEDRVLLRTDTSSKTERRETSAGRYRIIAWFGDSLADFDEEFEDGASGTAYVRRQRAEAARSRWGADWFVLPNPTYGDFLGVLEQPLSQNLAGPSELSR